MDESVPHGNPAEAIRAFLKERRWTQDDLSRVIGWSRQQINAVANGRAAVTTDLAVALAAAFGTEPQFWLELEAKRGERDRSAAISAVARRSQLHEMAPIREMRRRGWIKDTNDCDVLERELLEFFSISSLSEQPQFTVATRRSNACAQELTPAQLVWCMRASQLAASLPAAPFDPSRLHACCAEMRKLAAFVTEANKLPSLLASYGVRFVVVESIGGSKIDGAAFWLNERSPVIALSIRYDRIDSFWFTVFHEFAHIRAGDALSIDVDLAGEHYEPTAMKNDIEHLADTFACEALVPNEELSSFIRRVSPLYSRTRIVQFAHRVKMHPGVIVGQLHHRAEVGYSAHRDLLVKIRDVATETALTDGFGRFVPRDD